MGIKVAAVEAPVAAAPGAFTALDRRQTERMQEEQEAHFEVARHTHHRNK